MLPYKETKQLKTDNVYISKSNTNTGVAQIISIYIFFTRAFLEIPTLLFSFRRKSQSSP